MAFETIAMAILTHPVHTLFVGMLFVQAVRFRFAKVVTRKAPSLRLAQAS